MNGHFFSPLAIAFMACTAFTWACESSPTGIQPSVAVVYGSVQAEDSTPVAGESVRMLVYPLDAGGCEDGEESLAGWATTDDSGGYRVVGAFLHVQRADMCVAIEARPPEGAGLGEARVAGAEVTFIHKPDTPPLDSVRVDVVLPQVP